MLERVHLHDESGALRQSAASQGESLIVTLKQEKPHWGTRKVRELLVRRLDGDSFSVAT